MTVAQTFPDSRDTVENNAATNARANPRMPTKKRIHTSGISTGPPPRDACPVPDFGVEDTNRPLCDQPCGVTSRLPCGKRVPLFRLNAEIDREVSVEGDGPIRTQWKES